MTITTQSKRKSKRGSRKKTTEETSYIVSAYPRRQERLYSRGSLRGLL